MTRVAINGFGRIGRTFFRQAFARPELEMVAINDLGDLENLAYLLKYDTLYRTWEHDVKVEESDGQRYLVVGKKKILVLSKPEPEKLPWDSLKVDVVVESTGMFASEEGGKKHLEAGAKRVVISAPAKGEVEHVLIGVNDERLSSPELGEVTANASCTTNASAAVLAVLEEKLGIEKGIVQTVHAYTATQALVDGPDRKGDFRRGRAAAANIIPSHTGAAEAVAKSLPGLKGKFDGVALRVPVLGGSLAMLTVLTKMDTTVEEINELYRKASQEPRWQGVLAASEDPLVSSDVIGTTEAAIVDLTFTRVTGGNLVTVFAWYDNEWAYSATLVEHVVRVGKLLT